MRFGVSLFLPTHDYRSLTLKIGLGEKLSWEIPIPSWLKYHPIDDTFEYGFSYFSDGFSIYYGLQHYDSSKTKSKTWSIPWNNTTWIRESLYNSDQVKVVDLKIKDRLYRTAKEIREIKENHPKQRIRFKDFDGEYITASCYIREMEWHYGSKWCSWLKYFKQPIINRWVDITFENEVGVDKGSYKGGLVGVSEDIYPGEKIIQAFSRRAEKLGLRDLRIVS